MAHTSGPWKSRSVPSESLFEVSGSPDHTCLGFWSIDGDMVHCMVQEDPAGMIVACDAGVQEQIIVTSYKSWRRQDRAGDCYVVPFWV